MNVNVRAYLILASTLLFLSVAMLSFMFIKRLDKKKGSLSPKNQISSLLNFLAGKALDTPDNLTMNQYFQMKQAIQMSALDNEKIAPFIHAKQIEKRYSTRLKSSFKTKRMEAAVSLGILGTENARVALENSIVREKEYPVKLYMANALAEINNKASLSILISTLLNAHRWYRERVNMLIADYGDALNDYLPEIIRSEQIEIKELIVDFASIYFSEEVKTYLIHLIDTKEDELNKLKLLYGARDETCCANCVYGTWMDNEETRLCKYRGKVSAHFSCHKYRVLPVSVNSQANYEQLVYKAAEILGRYYPKILAQDNYLNSEDLELKKIAVKALSKFNNVKNMTQLLGFVKDDELARVAANALSAMIERNPNLIHGVVGSFEEEETITVKQRLAEVLATRIEYFIMKLTTKNRKSAAEIIKQILLMERTSEVIDFLNKNKDIDLENELIAIIREVVVTSPVLEKEFSRYLNERVAQKCKIQQNEVITPIKQEQKDKKLIRSLYAVLASSVLIFPLIYVIRHYQIMYTTPILQQLELFVLDFNYYLAFYAIAINLIYLVLLFFSVLNVKQQVKLWRIKTSSLLFKRKMLPSISIIAPAYNEEKTIIESSNSLLNLKYPDCELIIVNDGSKDRTLDVLIQYYDLIRVDYIIEPQLNTKPIRGIYMNRSMPKLMVVDKENGGKADSLNAGINLSRKEYFCGIDADSLLEDEALLKLASLTLDEGIETPALGGNIFPINGCTVERGQIVKVQIPKNPLARFQSIEYIRAFMAGRLGWAKINSLLIISGAFGLFRKERVIRVGGYLTSSGKYAKDTVGEDMELVVRISRLMRELGQKFRIGYAFNANCWTEVPEDLSSLKKQRYRWHRGLVEILTFHKRMLFNSRYGRTGIIALPYFLIFEMLGPLIEGQGYVMVLIAFLLGLLNPEVVLLLFVSTILMGILVSVTSLVIAEWDTHYFKRKDLLILVFYAIFENFGPRQMFSMWRIGGTLNMLKRPSGWGKLERKGFTASNTSVKG